MAVTALVFLHVLCECFLVPLAMLFCISCVSNVFQFWGTVINANALASRISLRPRVREEVRSLECDNQRGVLFLLWHVFTETFDGFPR